MHTLTSDQLARLLRASAAGYRPSEAAAQLLTDHRAWLDRRDFRQSCVEYDHDGTTPMAWVDWQAVPAFLDRAGTACSASEARILALAAEIAGVDTGTPLAELLASLDDHNSRLVLDAIGHVLTRGGQAGWLAALGGTLVAHDTRSWGQLR
jgi:hypothetical protein